MIMISATGGSGSSVVASSFKDKGGWTLCKRPDGGRQKVNRSEISIWRERVKPFFKPPKDIEDSEEARFVYTVRQLQKKKQVATLCMTWGGLGLMNAYNVPAIYLVRDPVYAFNSYSGGGWRDKGGRRRLQYFEATGPNSRVWIDAWLGSFALWVDTARNAVEAVKADRGFVLRYHRLLEDWAKIPGMPPPPDGFKCKDNPAKYENVLSEKTIQYLRSRTDDVWREVEQLP